MVSKITSIRADASRSLSEKLNQSAYGYYNTTVIELSEQKTITSKAKHLAAAALLSSSSIMVLGAPASAATICTPATTNGATITCAGPPTNSIAKFSGDNLTIIATDAFSFDSTAVSIGQQRVNSGIYIQGSGGTIRHSGTIITGEVAEGPSGPYGQHNGLFILGGTGDVYAENTSTGSITTTAYESNGIQISATTGTSTAINRGTILTAGDSSYGVAAANAATAISRNFGTVTTQNSNGQGVYSYSSAGAATSSNDGTINIAGHTSAGIVAVGSTSATGTNNSSGIINVSGAGAAGGVFAAVSAATGVASATNSGAINLTGVYGPTYHGFANFGVIASGARAAATNAAGAAITDTGTQVGTIGIFATTQVFNPFDGSSSPAGMGVTTADANNQGTITLQGNYGNGVRVLASNGTATATNGGTISLTGNGVAGIRAGGQTVVATNTGAITVTGSGKSMSKFGDAIGIFAYSYSPATTTVTNSGTITATGSSPIGVFASGPTTNVTNSAGGTITATTAIAVGSAQMATVNNAGTLNGNVSLGFGKFLGKSTDQASVTNTGTINGQINSHSFYNTTVVNNGGTVGDGNYAIFTGLGNNSVTISGTGNVIKGAIQDRAASLMNTATLAFNQTDTLVLDDGGYGNVAVQNFTSINFNSGTTSFDGTSILSPNATIGVNAGATLTTGSAAFGITAPQLNVGGMGAVRGTVAVPAGSTITVSGDVTFDSGGRFQPGIASDTSAGLLTAANVTFNAGSEVYADVTRGIELTSGNASKVATATTAITDNGLSVYDNSILFSFTHEIRTGNELYLIAKRELRAVTATDNNNGRTPAQNIAGAIDAFIDSAPSNNPIVAYLAQFPVAEQEARLFQLVKDSLPEEAGATGGSAVASADMVLDLIMGRLANGSLASAGSASGVSAGEQPLGGIGGWAIWGQASASFADYNPAVINGFESDTYAMSGGIDGDVADDLRLGLSLFYSNTNVDETGAGANSAQDIKGIGALLYGTYRPEAFYVNGTLGLGLNEYESARNALGGVNRADYDGYQVISSFELGKAITDGNWELSPHIGARFNYVAIEGFTETGPLPTSIGSQNITSLRGLLGLSGRYTHDLEDGSKLIPEGYVRAIREMADPNGAITGSVVGGGTFISQTAARDNLSYALGAGMTYEMDNSLSIRFLYEGEYQEDYQEHSLSAAVRFQF